MVTCVECREQDSPGRIAPLSYCDHRVCLGFRRQDCSYIHTNVCPAYCRAVRQEPIPRDVLPPQIAARSHADMLATARPVPAAAEQGALFDLAVST